MPTFSSILSSFSQTQETRSGVAKHLRTFNFFCLALSSGLFALGFYFQRADLIFWGYLPLCLIIVGMLVDLFLDVEGSRPFFRNPGIWLADGLDRRFAQEKSIAAELSTKDSVELKRMSVRLEADLTRAERWLDVLKPLSMLAPVLLVLVTAGVFKLPDIVQELCKIAIASATVGALVAVITIYHGLVRLRTLSSALHYAIDLAEEKKKPSVRKVSRKRGQSSRFN